jgi:hypothetical protein
MCPDESRLRPARSSGGIRRRSVLVLVAGAVPLAGGCGRRGGLPPAYEVTGTVTVGGEPLAAGAITFEPADGKGSVYEGLIRDGRYEVKVAAGTKLVRIIGMKNTGEIGPDGQPLPSQFLPPRYNTKSKLTAEVKPARNELPFELPTGK